MANLYIAINGDDVGTRIGEAIASDDHEGLAAASSAIEGAHGNIDQWVESVGGKKITRSGDEGIYLIPEEALSDLENVKSSYSEQSGHGLTVGVGNSMSEASKALIYGKLNGKDQVVHYDPMIEDYLSDEDADDEMPEDVQVEEQDDSSEQPVADDDSSDQESEDDEQDSGNAQIAAKKPSPMAMEADNNPDEADGEDDKDDSEQAEEQADDEMPEDADMDMDDDQSAPDEDEGDDHQKTSQAPPNKMQQDSDMDDDSDDADMDDDQSVEDQIKDPDADDSQAIDGDSDGQDFGADKDDSESEEQNDEMAAAQPPMQQEMPPADDSQAESPYAGLNQDDESNPDMDLDNESYDGEDGDEDALSGMIHGDMQDDEQGMEPPGAPEQEMPESQLDDELRQDIASALMAFKENKDMLEQAREQNPKLYQATITMLRSMIEMAKKLGANPAQDMQDQEGEQQLQEEFPEAEEYGDQEDVQQGPPGTPSVSPDTGGESTEKKQQGRPQ